MARFGLGYLAGPNCYSTNLNHSNLTRDSFTGVFFVSKFSFKAGSQQSLTLIGYTRYRRLRVTTWSPLNVTLFENASVQSIPA